jgi:lipoprotein-anchoring transpeptidase ErfK/SrfK
LAASKTSWGIEPGTRPLEREAAAYKHPYSSLVALLGVLLSLLTLGACGGPSDPLATDHVAQAPAATTTSGQLNTGSQTVLLRNPYDLWMTSVGEEATERLYGSRGSTEFLPALSSRGGETTTTAPPTTTTIPASAVVDGVLIEPSYRVVQAIGTVHVADSPGGKTVQTIERLNVLKVVTTMLATGSSIGLRPVWYEVLLPSRPNGSTGWVSSDEVHASRVSTAIVVKLGTHRLTICYQARVVASYPICVGTAKRPTPTGTFYAIGVLIGDPGDAYGAYAIGTSAFSDTLTDWPGGGVVGIHGTNNPSSIGRNVSHGCIRLKNSDITQLAQMVSLGTPIYIVK